MADKNNLADMLVADAFDRIDHKLDRIDQRADKINETLVKQQGILDKQQVSIDEHIRRTNLLEAKLEKDVNALRDGMPEAIVQQIHKTNLQYLKLVGKGLAFLAGTGIGAGLIKMALDLLLKMWS